MTTFALALVALSLPLSSCFVAPSVRLSTALRAGIPDRGDGLPDLPIPPLTPEDYVAVGLACCYMTNEDNKLDEDWIVEPLTSGTLETIDLGVPTSYKRVLAVKLGEFLEGTIDAPTGVNKGALTGLVDGYQARLCSNIEYRTLAAARTFKRRVEAQLIEVGDLADDFNFNTDVKRVTNEVFEPSFDDNVKQDSSIDVYGREEELDDEVARLANA